MRTSRHDDLAEWADDPVVRALQADGTEQERAGVEPVLAAFRTAVPPRVRRRLVHRLGTGATTVVVALGLTGGVAAAAYTRALPGPLQSAMHSLLGPVGVPASEPALPRTRPLAERSRPAPVSHPSGAVVAPAADPTRAQSPRPTAAPAEATPSPAATAVGTPAPAAPASPAAPAASSPPAPSPSPSASASPKPASLAARAGRLRVPVGQRVGVKATLLTASGDAVAGHRVYLQQRPHGGDTWQRVAAGRTRADGTVVLRTPELSRNVDVRLVTPQGLRSASIAIKVLPSVTVSMSTSPNGKRYAVTVKVAGAQTGDTVTLSRRSNGDWSRVATKQLPDSATLTFSVPVPAADVHYRVRVVATQVHADGFGTFTATPG